MTRHATEVARDLGETSDFLIQFSDIPDATDALAQILEHHARLLRLGASREDTANTLLPIVRLATGRT